MQLDIQRLQRRVFGRQHGVYHFPDVFRILKDEIDKCLALIGVPRLADVGRANLRMTGCGG